MTSFGESKMAEEENAVPLTTDPEMNCNVYLILTESAMEEEVQERNKMARSIAQLREYSEPSSTVYSSEKTKAIIRTRVSMYEQQSVLDAKSDEYLWRQVLEPRRRPEVDKTLEAGYQAYAFPLRFVRQFKMQTAPLENVTADQWAGPEDYRGGNVTDIHFYLPKITPVVLGRLWQFFDYYRQDTEENQSKLLKKNMPLPVPVYNLASIENWESLTDVTLEEKSNKYYPVWYCHYLCGSVDWYEAKLRGEAVGPLPKCSVFMMKHPIDNVSRMSFTSLLKAANFLEYELLLHVCSAYVASMTKHVTVDDLLAQGYITRVLTKEEEKEIQDAHPETTAPPKYAVDSGQDPLTVPLRECDIPYPIPHINPEDYV